MRRSFVVVCIAVGLCAAGAGIIRGKLLLGKPIANFNDGEGTYLPNGWRVSPAGTATALPGDMPLKFAFSADGKKLVVATCGFHDQGLSVLNVGTGTLEGSTALRKCSAGMAMGSGRITVSCSDLAPKVFALGEAGLKEIEEKGFALPGSKGYLEGMAFLPDGSLVAADLQGDSVVKYSPQLSVVNKARVGYRPYGIAVSPDNATVAVTNWGDGSVTLLNSSDLAVKATVKVGSHPNELAFSHAGELYVANGGSNSVSIIRGTSVIGTVFTSLQPNDPIGSTPNALAITADSKTLFVANAGNNDVAVIDISKPTSPRVNGFIPTGWYPTAVAVTPDGKRLVIGVGKGLMSSPNDVAKTKYTRQNYDGRFKYDYIGGCLNGAVSFVDIPNHKKLNEYTALVRRNVFARNKALVASENAEIQKKAFSKIKHVVYIIRENRTYDQVFGDMKGSNADPNLVLFGNEVTPNAHAMARRWVLLDNIYCDGEVSEDGHQWCDAAYATDFNERAWVSNYSGRGEPDADERLTNSPAGYLWDNCAKHGKSFLSYGEVADFESGPDKAPEFVGNKGLAGHASLEWAQHKGRDYEKAEVFIADLKAAEASGKWPNFMVMSLPEDHTSGLQAGAFTPKACVASNDLALAKMVSAVSRSKFWKETAIFVIEDDAQNGPDHVDAHRTVALVISPYAKRRVLDSTMYSTSSMVRTMELILGLPPMTQFDKTATPMYACFTSTPDFTPYEALPETIDMEARNPKAGLGARLSAELDLSTFDRADPNKLNRILWLALRPNEKLPPSVHSFHTR